MDEITALDAAALLKEEPDDIVLLDVREPAELQAASVEGALHIPMADVPNRLDDIDPAKIIICMCHMGGRSAQVTGFLNNQGYNRAINLSGGILAWAEQVDPSVFA